MRSPVVVCVGVAVVIAVLGPSPASALPQFKKAFEERYTKDASEEFKEAVKKAGCNTCHVKGEKDRKVRNAYGEVLAKLVEGDAKDRIKADKAKVLKEFDEAMEKAECEKEGDVTYADLFKAGKLPSPEKAKE